MQTPGNAEENTGTSSIGAVDIAGPVRFPACALVRRPFPHAGYASHSPPHRSHRVARCVHLPTCGTSSARTVVTICPNVARIYVSARTRSVALRRVRVQVLATRQHLAQDLPPVHCSGHDFADAPARRGDCAHRDGVRAYRSRTKCHGDAPRMREGSNLDHHQFMAPEPDARSDDRAGP